MRLLKRYVDKSGGLVVDKSEPVKLNNVEDHLLTEIKSSTISAQDVIDTMQTYQTGNFSVLDSSAKGVCVFCGKQTAAKNRHVCVDCWKQTKNEIIDGLKTAVKDVELKID